MSEQINELSKKTLGSYVKKAATGVQKHSAQLGYHGAKHGMDNKAMAAQDKMKLGKRIKGIKKATDRLMKEETMTLENSAAIGDVITLIANEQPGEATTILNALLSTRVSDAMQDFKQEIAQTLFAAPTDLSEEAEQIDEMSTRKDFQQVASVIAAHPNASKRKELAAHHAGIFKAQNPRFDHKRFYAACNAGEPGV